MQIRTSSTQLRDRNGSQKRNLRNFILALYSEETIDTDAILTALEDTEEIKMETIQIVED